MKGPLIKAVVLTAMLIFSCAMEIRLYPPQLTVMDDNLTMISCVVRFNSTEPTIYFRFNEIWIIPGFNYKQLTDDGLSPPHGVPCPPLYADNRKCMVHMMYVIGTPKINGSSLMCTALVNGMIKANSSTVTITVTMQEDEPAASTPSPSPYPSPYPPPSPPPSPSSTPVGEASTRTAGCDCNSTDTDLSIATGVVVIPVPVLAGFFAVLVFLLLVVGIAVLLMIAKRVKKNQKRQTTEDDQQTDHNH